MEEEKLEQQVEMTTREDVAPKPPETAQTDGAPDEKKQAAGGRDTSRRNILHLACGGYLVYLAVKLLVGLIDDLPKSGWNANTIIALVGTVVFAAVGITLLVGLARRFLHQLREDAKNQDNGAER